MAAVYELVRRFNPRKIYINAIVELSDLGGRAKLPAEAETTALITY